MLGHHHVLGEEQVVLAGSIAYCPKACLLLSQCTRHAVRATLQYHMQYFGVNSHWRSAYLPFSIFLTWSHAIAMLQSCSASEQFDNIWVILSATWILTGSLSATLSISKPIMVSIQGRPWHSQFFVAIDDLLQLGLEMRENRPDQEPWPGSLDPAAVWQLTTIVAMVISGDRAPMEYHRT